MQIQNNQISLSGKLNFETVMDLLESGKALIKNQNNIQVDLSSVTLCNSAGLALLSEWFCFAKKLNKKIVFTNIPQQLLNIARVCDLLILFEGK